METNMLENDVGLARAIAGAVASRGGRAYYVGGYVRDKILGRPSKDVDIEVHGLSTDSLVGVLGEFGEVDAFGASFGILSIHGYGLDISLSAPGDVDAAEHGACGADSRLDVRAAARRRDLTMNALYEDVLTGEVIDCFGGVADMERGVVRHVDSATFAQDRLRVLRVAQLAARFDMRVAEETTRLCAGIDLSDVAAERVLEELRKALLKPARPSLFFEELRAMGRLGPWFVEVEDLVGVPQNPVYHPEGDVWVHTMMVLDAAATMREQATDPFAFMLSALVHDVGKAQATRTLENGRIVSYEHEHVGVPLARAFLERIGASAKARSYVLNMVKLHMAPTAYVAQDARQKAYNKMFDRSCCPRDLLLLSAADRRGRTGRPSDEAMAAELERRLGAFEELMARPFVQGADLIELGMRPGPQMGEVLAYAHKLRLAGVSKEEALRHCAGQFRSLLGEGQKHPDEEQRHPNEGEAYR